jgi:hypothetical protein
VLLSEAVHRPRQASVSPPYILHQFIGMHTAAALALVAVPFIDRTTLAADAAWFEVEFIHRGEVLQDRIDRRTF